MTTLSQRIRKARTTSALTQAQLASRIGVKRSAVTQWEHPSGTSPSVEHLIQIATETGAGFEWLATGRGDSLVDIAATTPALVVADYAHDQYETEALAHLRRLPMAKKRMAVAILDAMAR